MSSIPDYDCSRKCHYIPHGNCVTSALTKRSISDEKLAAYLAKICRNFYDIVDDQGRSALHLAASVGRYAVLEWLLIQGATINVSDVESGSSPLHRAIFYGNIDCAVLLARYGASLDVMDEDTRNPLQSVCRLCDYSTNKEISASNELLVWGSNKNYNLGLGNESGSDQPTSIEFFRKQHISIESAALGTYHSFFVDKKSQLYAVGHGKGGRLGISIENTLAAPKKVKVPIKNADEHIINVSVSRKHSLVLTNRSVIYACGLNEDQQLGVRDAGDRITTFKEVLTLRDLGVTGLMRVIALDHYSIAYSKEAMYIWGTNSGQFGMKHNEMKIIPAPKQMMLPPRTSIKFVEANNSAIALVTKENLILLMFNAKMKTIKPPNYEDIKSVCVFGGDSDKAAKGTVAALKLIILTTTNVVYIWYEMKQSFFRCNFSQIRLTQIDKILYKGNQVIILSQGDVYSGKCNQVPVPAFIVEHEASALAKQTADRNGGIWSNNDQNRTEISKDYMIRIDLQRIPIVDRVVDIFCNNDFTSFAVLQESTSKYFKLPTLTAEEYVFKKLYNDSSVYDSVHDIVFHVDDDAFAAHKLLIYARAPGLSALIIDDGNKSVHLNYETLTSKMFELILKHIYTNYLPNDDDLDDINTSLGPKRCDDNETVLQLFLIYVEKFQLTNLMKFLQSHLEEESSYLPLRVDKSKYRFNRLRQIDFPMLYDVRIICENDVELPAHKCILVARLEYFEMMFTHTWAESSVINLKSVPVEYMQPILDFLYTSDVEQFRKHNYAQNFLYNMIVFCDQFFIERLRKVCEISIVEKINVRNCGEMLDFAVMYNCELLKRGCLDFICQNLSRILSCRSLEECDAEALCCINGYYKKMFKDVFDYRVITPDAQAIEDDLLLCVVDDFTVNLQEPLQFNQEYNHKNKKSQDAIRTNNPKHKYERDAISTMMCQELEQRKPRNNLSESQVNLEIQRTDATIWTKVGDKKDGKKRHTSEQSEKMNVTIPSPLSANTSANEKYVWERATPEKEADVANEYEPPTTKLNSISLSEFTPTKEKLSQKQRKRLASSSSTTVVSPTSAMPIKSAEIQQNAWGILPSQTSVTDEPHLAVNVASPITGSSGDPTSFANMIRGSSVATSPSTANANDNNSFSKILADERKQREYFERMRHKSLALTQIEEMAIDELHKFYNVDNITDEIITIARKPRAVSMNFAVWQRN